KYIGDTDILWLIKEVILSFQSTGEGKGLPLGNLTSQPLVNIYMNEFDQFIKHKLKAKYYIRYADDFVFLHHDKKYLGSLILQVSEFLDTHLNLTLHPDKLFIKTLASGVDFLGWVHFSRHRVLRMVTKRRMFLNVGKAHDNENVVASYKGMLSHGNGRKLMEEIEFFKTPVGALCDEGKVPPDIFH
ncbi:MAG: RNA-directed DNA polymerase, partial [Candidatus Yonathbacteria bacterium]|nr:RNA-directed DNA polymerase [Candidatus Yonathbacteria bacterium]